MKFQENYGVFKHIASGKVREIYLNEEDDELMVVATDRVSAFDQKLGIEIPGKGKILTAISAEFAKLADDWGIATAFYYADTPCPQDVTNYALWEFADSDIIGDASELYGRFTFMDNLEMLPVECIVRGYLFGSIWKLYKQGERVICGVELPDGLVKGSKLKEPIFTPTTKAPEGEHDQNITLGQMAKILEQTKLIGVWGDGISAAKYIRELCINLYQRASAWASRSGLIIADTKFELGIGEGPDGEYDVFFGDEILTPDSSRFWDAETYVPGEEPKSYDKQIIRDYLAEAKARGEVNPTLPAEIIETTRERYIELYERLFGKIWPRE